MTARPRGSPHLGGHRAEGAIVLVQRVDIPWPLNGRPQQSRWRLPAAFGALTEAVGHIPVTQDHLIEAPYIGVGFILLTVAGLLLAQLLLLADTAAVWIWTAIVSAAAVLGYLLSRTVGLPQIRDDVGDWGEPLGIVCLAAEVIMLAAAFLHWRTRLARQAWHRRSSAGVRVHLLSRHR